MKKKKHKKNKNTERYIYIMVPKYVSFVLCIIFEITIVHFLPVNI